MGGARFGAKPYGSRRYSFCDHLNDRMSRVIAIVKHAAPHVGMHEGRRIPGCGCGNTAQYGLSQRRMPVHPPSLPRSSRSGSNKDCVQILSPRRASPRASGNSRVVSLSGRA